MTSKKNKFKKEKEQFKNQIGEVVRKYRKDIRGLTLREAAEIVGFSRSYISHVENGTAMANSFALYHIAGRLKIPFSILFGEDIYAGHGIDDPIIKEEKFQPYIEVAKNAYTRDISVEKLEKALELAIIN